MLVPPIAPRVRTKQVEGNGLTLPNQSLLLLLSTNIIHHPILGTRQES
jgi:hypothetical protein